MTVRDEDDFARGPRSLADVLDVRAGMTVAVAGAGGKHTLMARLAQDLAGSGERVVLTSTTNLHLGACLSGFPRVFGQREAPFAEAVLREVARGEPIVAARRPMGEGMAKGIDPGDVEELRAALPGAVFLVKADGARKRLLKAPGDGEPVLPEVVDRAVLVLSLHALGRPLDQAHVHRLDRVRTLAGGGVVTEETFRAVARAYGERLPEGAVLYLSRCESRLDLDAARRVAATAPPVFARRIAADTIRGLYHEL